jgi:hypothetical protein
MDTTKSKCIFDILCARKEEIERVFGEHLDWLRQDNIQASLIRCVIPGGGLRDRNRWAEIQDQMIDTMVRLEQALRPEIKRLK